MIKAGEVSFIKTTGEAVFVLNVATPEPKNCPSLFDTVVTVRRPVMGQNGVRHLEDRFYLEELETLDEQRKRFIAEREEVMKKYGPKTEELNANPDTGFGIN